jgi:catechol-2,3-dioxygenase
LKIDLKLRIARHTDNLVAIEEFYCKIIGLDSLGGFQEHDGYNGLFLGKRGLDWHLEFTQSNEQANHQPDEDDLLVFYVKDENELNDFKRLFAVKKIEVHHAKNPYWNRNGILVKDPDGFGVVVCLDTRH